MTRKEIYALSYDWECWKHGSCQGKTTRSFSLSIVVPIELTPVSRPRKRRVSININHQFTQSTYLVSINQSLNLINGSYTLNPISVVQFKYHWVWRCSPFSMPFKENLFVHSRDSFCPMLVSRGNHPQMALSLVSGHINCLFIWISTWFFVGFPAMFDDTDTVSGEKSVEKSWNIFRRSIA